MLGKDGNLRRLYGSSPRLSATGFVGESGAGSDVDKRAAAASQKFDNYWSRLNELDADAQRRRLEYHSIRREWARQDKLRQKDDQEEARQRYDSAAVKATQRSAQATSERERVTQEAAAILDIYKDHMAKERADRSDTCHGHRLGHARKMGELSDNYRRVLAPLEVSRKEDQKAWPPSLQLLEQASRQGAKQPDPRERQATLARRGIGERWWGTPVDGCTAARMLGPDGPQPLHRSVMLPMSPRAFHRPKRVKGKLPPLQQNAGSRPRSAESYFVHLDSSRPSSAGSSDNPVFDVLDGAITGALEDILPEDPAPKPPQQPRTSEGAPRPNRAFLTSGVTPSPAPGVDLR